MILVEANIDKQLLSKHLEELSGYKVAKVLRSIGTVLYFKLGSVRKDEEGKKYPKYEASILVELNNWTLLRDGVLFLSDNELEDLITEKIRILEGQTLEKGQLTQDDDFPIEFVFSNGYVLKVSDTWPPREWGLSVGLPNDTYLEIDRNYNWRVVSADHTG